mgnify:CR=1 FL=1
MISVFATIDDYEKGQFTLPCQRALLCCAGIQGGTTLYPALPALRAADEPCPAKPHIDGYMRGRYRPASHEAERTREGGGGLLERRCDSPPATRISPKAETKKNG